MRSVPRLSLGVALFLTGFALASTSTADDPASHNQPAQQYLLQIAGDRISLQATDIPLIQIVEDIGERMDIQVVIQVPKEEWVTVKFEALPLEKALQRLSKNHALVTDKEAGRISKIFLLPKGHEDSPMERAAVSSPEPVSDAQAAGPTEDPADTKQSKPFEFTFDPSQFEPQTPR